MSDILRVPHPTLSITAKRCGPADEEPLLDRLETLLHADYYFRRGHFQAILARPQAAVYAILVEGDFAAIAILYNGSTLQNLYVHPEHKRQGVGKALIEFFRPAVIRSKSNMSQGDPSAFYEKQGYQFAEADPHRPHIHLMTKDGLPPPPPTATPKPPISDARRAQLDAARQRSIEKRRQAREAATIAQAPTLAPPPTPHVAPPTSPTVAEAVPVPGVAVAEPTAFGWPWPD